MKIFNLIFFVFCLLNFKCFQIKSSNQQFEGQYNLVQINSNEPTFFEGILQYQGDMETYLSDTNKIVKKLKFTLKGNNENELTIKFQRIDKPEFELPEKFPFPNEKNRFETIENPNYSYKISKINEQFQLQIFKNNDQMIYSSQNLQLIYTDQFIQFGTEVHGDKFWGWGQRRGIWEYSDGEYTIWNSDNPAQISTGKAGQQTYGTHPVWLSRQTKNQNDQNVTSFYYMAYLRTSQGLLLKYQKNKQIKIQMVGGPIEIKFFTYKTPKENIQEYHRYINGWALQPFYSMGFQICRWGIKNSKKWENVWQQANQHKISFDVMWSDIDYLQDYEDFTISDKYDVETMKTVTDLKTEDGVHWVPIIDAGVGYYSVGAETGISKDIFIKTQEDTNLIGCVWPGPAYFADFNHPDATQFWINGLQNITSVYNGPQPSGIWNDMNDPSNFVNGQVDSPDGCPSFPLSIEIETEQKQVGSNNDDADLPWSPNGKKPLDQRTLSINGKHYNKHDSKYVYVKDFQITEKEFHNLYAFFEGIATYEYLEQQGNQALPYIVTRSSFAGQGRFTQIWTGDNYSSWKQLETSLGDIFNFQIFGIPMVGPDVCGFSGFPTSELCARWYQLGAWYPFYRSHTDHFSSNQYPWSFKEPYVLDSTRDSINIRYSFAKWYYTIFVRECPLGTIFNPLFFEYPQDEMSINEAHQALIGNEIMVTPVLQSGDSQLKQTTIKIYFPGEKNVKWYYYLDYNKEFYGQGVYDIDIAFDSICPFFIKQGSIIAQQPQVLNTNQTTRTRYLDNQFRLIVALDQNMSATGSLLGISDYNDQNLIKDKCHKKLQGSLKNCELIIQAQILQKDRIQIQIQKTLNYTYYDSLIQINSIQLLGYGVNPLLTTNLKFDENNTSYTVNINEFQQVQE